LPVAHSVVIAYSPTKILVIGHHLTSISVPCTVILSDVRDRVITVSQAKVFFSLVIVFFSSLFVIIPCHVPHAEDIVKKNLSYYRINLLLSYAMP